MAVCDLPGCFLRALVIDELRDQAFSAPEAPPDSPAMGISDRGTSVVGCGHTPRVRARQIRKPSISDLRATSAGRIRQTVLDRCDMGNMRHYFATGSNARCRSFLFWRSGPAWSTYIKICGVLGSFFPDSRLVRRIHYPRIYAVHIDTWNGFLAGSAPALDGIWRSAFRKPWRSVGGCASGGFNWPVLVLDSAAHGNLVVRSRDARLVGLGGE